MHSDWRASQRVATISKSAIHEMTRLSKQYQDVAFLSWAKPTAGCPDHIRRAAAQAVTDGAADGYSENAGLQPLREEIAKKLRTFNGIPAAADEIVVTVGAIEGLAAAVMATIDPGDEVIMPSPTYSTHIRQVQLASGKPVMVPLQEDQGFRLDPDMVEAAITPKTKAIMFCSPNNPTGTLFDRATLKEIARIAHKHRLLIITDEAYEYFTYDQDHVSIGSFPEVNGQVISCYTFTKTYAMTGWRIGYLHAAADLIPQIKKAHIPLAICAPVVSQYAALAALTGPQSCIAEFRGHYRQARDAMCRRLDGLKQVFSYVMPEGSYLMFPRILLPKGRDSIAFCKYLLKEIQVSTTPGIAFGPTGESHLRLSFCVPTEMIHRAFDRMEKLFAP